MPRLCGGWPEVLLDSPSAVLTGVIFSGPARNRKGNNFATDSNRKLFT